MALRLFTRWLSWYRLFARKPFDLSTSQQWFGTYFSMPSAMTAMSWRRTVEMDVDGPWRALVWI